MSNTQEQTRGEIIPQNSYICVIRTQFTGSSLAQLQKAVMFQQGGVGQGTVKCYSVGKTTHTRSLYERHKFFVDGLEEQDGVRRVPSDEFSAAKGNRRYILELIVSNDNSEQSSENVDITILQYLIPTLEGLRFLGEKVSVFFYGEKGGKIDSLKYDTFPVRAKVFLSLYSEVEEYKELVSEMFGFTHYGTKAAQKVQWQRLTERPDKETTGKMLPLIPITKESYMALTRTGRSALQNAVWHNALNKLCEDAKEKLSSEQKDSVEKIINQDCLLDKIVFLKTLQNLDLSSQKEMVFLHETCLDYAQGLAQLIENALYHAVIGNEGIRGCASFTIRIREEKDARYIKNPQKNPQKMYMEIYITDVQFDGEFKSITQKFIENVNNNPNKASMQSVVQNLLNVSDKVKLAHLFGEEALPELSSYLKEPQNVALHYGLQILGNTIAVGRGALFVRSGDSYFNGEKDCYCEPTLEWHNGTAYIIYLPIQYEGMSKTYETFLVDGKLEEEKFDFREIKIANINISADPSCTAAEKQKRVEAVKNHIIRQLKKGKNFCGVIDCAILNIQQEVLAKAIFLCFAANNGLQNMALINVADRHEVIKLFRQFALFYNRKGENDAMKGKSVYIVDTSAKTDVLLLDSVKSIQNNMEIGRIFGGTDDAFMEIIEHLVAKTGGVQNE